MACMANLVMFVFFCQKHVRDQGQSRPVEMISEPVTGTYRLIIGVIQGRIFCEYFEYQHVVKSTIVSARRCENNG
jgi:hypothetical protein